MEVRERFLQAMDLAGLESWRRFQRSHCDEWEQLMGVDLDQAFAFDLLRAKADAAWWLARREQTLAELAREMLASLPAHHRSGA